MVETEITSEIQGKLVTDRLIYVRDIGFESSDKQKSICQDDRRLYLK